MAEAEVPESIRKQVLWKVRMAGCNCQPDVVFGTEEEKLSLNVLHDADCRIHTNKLIPEQQKKEQK